MRVLLLAAALLLLAAVAAAGGVSGCKDASGKAVDWWAAIKLPVLSDSDTVSGDELLYADANQPTLRLLPASGDVTSASGPLGSTLAVLYGGANVGFLMYNDQWPDGKDKDSYGHTKGVAAWDSNSGFWLVHSVPRFPPDPTARNAKYAYPDPQTRNGQSFLCMSLSDSELDRIAGGAWLYNKPAVYASALPDSHRKLFPNVVAVLAGTKWINDKAASAQLDVRTLGGQALTVFAKNPKFGKDLWQDAVAPALKSSLLVSSWLNGRGTLDSTCRRAPAYDVRSVRELTAAKDMVWANSKDHSKWAISSDISSWLLIGDINRQEGQFDRGGGAVALKLRSIYTSFCGLISGVDSCPSDPALSCLAGTKGGNSLVVSTEDNDMAASGDEDHGHSSSSSSFWSTKTITLTSVLAVLALIFVAVLAVALVAGLVAVVWRIRVRRQARRNSDFEELLLG